MPFTYYRYVICHFLIIFKKERIPIYYFSGTGNSLKIATEISKKIDNCKLIPIAFFCDFKGVKTDSKSLDLYPQSTTYPIQILLGFYLETTASKIFIQFLCCNERRR